MTLADKPPVKTVQLLPADMPVQERLLDCSMCGRRQDYGMVQLRVNGTRAALCRPCLRGLEAYSWESARGLANLNWRNWPPRQ